MSDQADDDNATEYGLLMPFIVTTDAGGPYDSAAYVAGCELGAIDVELARVATERRSSSLAPSWMANVHTQNLPQVDLVAMRHGFEVEAEPVPGMEDEWTAVTFRYAALADS